MSNAFPRTLKHEEYTYRGKRVILDTAEMSASHFETILMHTGGEAIAIYATCEEKTALADFSHLRTKYPPDCEKKRLTGKYAKLLADLQSVAEIGKQAADAVEDTGTCNLDAPALKLTGWRSALVEEAAKQAGVGCFGWNLFGSKYWVFCMRIPGQAYKREVAAEAMTEAFRRMGYESFCYQQAD